MHRRAKKEAESVPWTSVLAIDFPSGVILHPSVYDRVEAEIENHGSVCSINSNYPGVLMSYMVKANNRSRAESEANVIASDLLKLLGLTPEAVVDHTIALSSTFDSFSDTR